MICYRIPKGKKFCYQDKNQNTITDKNFVQYIKSLVIPPAWTNVEINSSPRAKICATGYDLKGRKQYLYNAKFRAKQEAYKFDHLLEFGNQVHAMRQTTSLHLRKRKLDREKVLATMLKLIETAYFRPGNELYTKQNKSFGLTTLQKKHLTAKGDHLTFEYLGKSGKMQQKQIANRSLAKIVKQLSEIPGKEIFKFIDENDNIRNVKPKHLNQYIHEVMGNGFSAKNFRTWGGSVMASQYLDEVGIVEGKNQKILKRNIKEAVTSVSEKLGNTPAIARKSYIDPRVFKNYEKGKILSDFKKDAKKLSKKHHELSDAERAFLCMMRK